MVSHPQSQAPSQARAYTPPHPFVSRCLRSLACIAAHTAASVVQAAPAGLSPAERNIAEPPSASREAAPDRQP